MNIAEYSYIFIVAFVQAGEELHVLAWGYLPAILIAFVAIVEGIPDELAGDLVIHLYKYCDDRVSQKFLQLQVYPFRKGL